MGKKEIFDELKNVAMICNGDTGEERLKAYTEFLFNKLGDKAVDAVKKINGKTSFFPSIKEILDNHQPPEDLDLKAQFIADEIVDAISAFGYPNELEAQKHIGPIGWSAVLGMGGWKTICKTQINDLPTLRAQLRRSCKANSSIAQSNPEQLLAERKKTLTPLFGNSKLVENNL